MEKNKSDGQFPNAPFLFVRVIHEAQLDLILVFIPQSFYRTLTLVFTADVNSILNAIQRFALKEALKATIVLGMQMTVTKINSSPLKVCEIIIKI